MAVPKLIEWQISNVRRLIAEESAKIAKANNIQQSLEAVGTMTRQNMIDLQYANSDEKRAIEARTKLQSRLDTLLAELNGNDEDEDDESATVLNNDVPIEQSEDSSSDNIQISDET